MYRTVVIVMQMMGVLRNQTERESLCFETWILKDPKIPSHETVNSDTKRHQYGLGTAKRNIRSREQHQSLYK